MRVDGNTRTYNQMHCQQGCERFVILSLLHLCTPLHIFPFSISILNVTSCIKCALLRKDGRRGEGGKEERDRRRGKRRKVERKSLKCEGKRADKMSTITFPLQKKDT